MQERFYQFVFRNENGNLLEINSYRDTDYNSAKLQAQKHAYSLEYYSNSSVTVTRTYNKQH